MKQFTKIALAATVAIAAMGANATNTPYVGLTVGQFDVDGAGKKATAYGVYGGYQFNESLGVELEYQGSSDAKFQQNSSVDTKYNVKTYGAYGTYKLPFSDSFYAKGKVGVAHSKAEVKGTVSGANYAHSNKDTGFAYGVGVGYKPMNNLAFELNYGRIASDAKTLGLGATYQF